MSFKLLYTIGTILLFVGLLWMFLPHAAHEAVTHEEESSHIWHVFQGLIVVVAGLALMIYSNRAPRTNRSLKNNSSHKR